MGNHREEQLGANHPADTTSQNLPATDTGSHGPLLYSHHMTVADIRRAIADLPDDAPVLYQRVEDALFEKHGWKTHDTPSADWPGESDQWVRAFTAVRFRGVNALFITAHY